MAGWFMRGILIEGKEPLPGMRSTSDSSDSSLSRTKRTAQTVGVELDPGAILSAAGNAERNGLRMDTYYPREVRRWLVGTSHHEIQ